MPMSGVPAAACLIGSINPRARTREELVGLELLCYLQQKNSPRREWSPFFTEQHPHPQIKLFRDLANIPRAIHPPKIGIWQEYRRELDAAFESVRLLARPPAEALAFCQRRVAASWQWHQRSLARRAADSCQSPVVSGESSAVGRGRQSTTENRQAQIANRQSPP